MRQNRFIRSKSTVYAKGLLIVAFLFGATLNVAGQPHATIVVSPGLTHNILRQLLPLKTTVSGPSGTLTFWFSDLYYCGTPTLGSKAVLLGIIQPGDPPVSQPLPVLSKSDCGTALSNIRVKPPLQPALATEMSLDWSNWSLNFTITSLVDISAGAPSSAVGTLRSALNAVRGPLVSFNTKGFAVTIGGSTKLALDAGIVFGTGGTRVALYRAGTTPALAALQDVAPVPVPADCTVETPYDFANAVFSNDLSSTPISIGSGVGPQAAVDHLAFAGSPNSLTVQGVLSQPGQPYSFALSVLWSGSDLALSQISVQAVHQPCATDDTACTIKNNILDGVASQFQTHYQSLFVGSLFRPTSYSDPVVTQILGVPVLLRLRSIHAEANPQSLIVQEIVGVEKP